MDRNLLFNIVLASMIVATVTALSGLGEVRIDVYLSLYTLEYFISKALIRPRRRFFDILSISLLVIFSIIVGLRIWEILQA